MKKLCFTVALLGVLIVAMPANAANYPTKPVTIVTAFGAGGAADLAMRLVAEYATKKGFVINVTNKPASGGSQAGQDVLKARADGYTVLYSTPNLQTLGLTKKLGFKITEDFVPVATITMVPMTFCVRSDSGVQTFDQWMDEALKNPGKYNYGSTGPVSSQFMFMTTLFKAKFPKADVPNVPYSGGHEVNTALLGSHIKAAFGIPGTNKNYLTSGDFKLLAVTSANRLPEYPDAPTFTELYGPEHTWLSYHGLFVKKGTPEPIITKLAAIVKEALNDPEVRQGFQKIGTTPDYLSPKEFAAEVATMNTKLLAVIKALNLAP